MKHIAVIPARMGSVGFKFKNRLFFGDTADFLDTVSWFDRVIVSTDDPVVKDMARQRRYSVHDRPERLAGGAVSIKAVFENVIGEMGLEADSILWLFYVNILYKNTEDFESAKAVVERDGVASLCSFIPASTHPFDTWRYDETTRTLSKYIPNDVFRRQDKPPAWEHYHYVCCFRASETPKLNSELINAGSRPMFLDAATVENLIEVDTPEEFEAWQKRKGGGPDR